MRAMILGAGRGTRMRSLAALCGKPALPVRGVPLVGHLLWQLAGWGVRRAVVNLHHRPETVREAALSWCPPEIELAFSEEEELLGTGGAIAQAADLLREGAAGAEPTLVLSGDMLIDLDMTAVLRTHRQRANDVTLVLADDPRAERFGSLGVDEDGRIRRIGSTVDWGGESDRGLFLGIRVLTDEALGWLAERKGSGAFEDLRDLFAPRIEAAPEEARIEAQLLPPRAFHWEPVGTPEEYLAANFLREPRWHRLDDRARERGTRLGPHCILGAGAEVPSDCKLHRVVVWPNERVAPAIEASDGVFAGGRFHSCSEPDAEGPDAR